MQIDHQMMRVKDLEKSVDFYTRILGMKLLRQTEYPDGKFTNTFVGYEPEGEGTSLELTYNWDPEEYDEGRNFGHVAYAVDDIYALCQKLMEAGVTINRPPRDGHMAFVRSPDNVSIELLQKDAPLPVREPWASMPNSGHW